MPVVFLGIDPNDARPVFRQIADEIQRSIAVGVMKPEDPLPAVRQVAAQLKVNANTVQQAYRTLEREGSVYVKRGIGTFVAPRPRDLPGRTERIARQLAERILQEGYRHGLLPSDLIKALQELVGGAHRTPESGS